MGLSLLRKICLWLVVFLLAMCFAVGRTQALELCICGLEPGPPLMDRNLTLTFLSPSYFIYKLLREFKEIVYVKYLSLEQSMCSVNAFVYVYTYADC